VPPDPLPWTSARLALRRFRPDDLQRFQAYRHDPEVARYQGWEPVSDEQAREFLAAMAGAPFWEPGEWLQIAIADRDDVLVGDIGLYTAASGVEAELGISLAREAQGRGLAEDAGRTLIDGLRAHTEARRLVAITDTRNAPSARLLRRLGMALEAEMPAELQGEPCMEWRFALEL
jgi:aminoglycoside 6'-N-acetyltransferase